MSKSLVNKSDTLKALAIEYMALQPNISKKEVCEKLNIPTRTLSEWCSDPDFGSALYKRAMVEYGLELPAILKALTKEAKGGNVQAIRTVLEHTGKLAKNNVNVIVSPWEMFMKDQLEGAEKKETEVKFEEIVEDDVIEVEQTNANKKGRIKEEKVKTFQEIQKEVAKTKRNLKQKEWYMWRKRAKAVGVEPLKNKRPTPIQRKEWEQSIIDAENKLSDSH